MFDDRFVRFIRRHRVLTLATTGGREPYCAIVFYAFDKKAGTLIFTSDNSTRHFREMKGTGFVAGSIVRKTTNVCLIQGLQLQGRVHEPTGSELSLARKRFLRRFPFAAAYSLSLWVLEPTFMKLTDNSTGFGRKLIWESNASEVI